MQHHKYSLTDLENMVNGEREIYVDILITYIKRKRKRKTKTKGLGK